MTFLPIVERELRVAARWAATHRIRLCVGGVAMLACGWTMFMLSMAGFGNMLGSALFVSLTWIATMYCYLGALYRAADSLSSEKREGTLGLLFLTDLTGFDVVLGKLAANSLQWTYGLLAMFPVLSISWLLGGVELLEFWLTILALINLLFAALAAGMLASSINRSERKAVLGTLVLLWLFAYGPQIAGYFLDKAMPGHWLGDAVPLLSPSYARDAAGDVRGFQVGGAYWVSLLLSHACGWAMLALASVILKRTWQDKAHSPAAARRAQHSRRLVLGGPEAQKRFRSWALNKNPFFWLACRYRRRRFLVMVATLALGVYNILSYLDYPVGGIDAFEFIFPFLLLHGMLKILFVFETCRRFVDDRQSGALELILCTPCGVKEIVRGQWMALIRHFLSAAVLVLVLDALVLALHGQWIAAGPGPDQRRTIMLWAAGILVFWVDMVVLGWMGMWLGLRSKHTMAAAGKSVLAILILPWLLFFLMLSAIMVVILYTQKFAGPGSQQNWTEYLGEILICGWVFLSLLTDAVFGLWARRRLLSRFREQVALQYVPAKGRWNWARKSKQGGAR